ncbi:MAG: AraC family transcriptional regulator [Lachnospiraceae bacterium]|nr:AraC family transcriptional regulator [Lachnospiraceae bacterium]MBR6474131.1 AraC family transcriptional regulator [Lachnospiraceae bacterium]
MEWLPYVHDAIEYIEKNLLSIKDIKEVADNLHISVAQLQKGFHVLTGYTLYEYIRNRRLYEAALEVLDGEKSILDIAIKYGYETHESFTKAFTRFHGVNPNSLRRNRANIRKFVSIQVKLVVDGGTSDNIKIIKKYPFTLIGYKYKITEELNEIQKFWNDIYEKHYAGIGENGEKDETASFIENNGIGEYGVLYTEPNGEKTYVIAGKYSGGEILDGMEKIEISEGEWAVIDYECPCFGGNCILDFETQKKRIEALTDYKYDHNPIIEWYESIDDDKDKQGYRSALWIPIKKKETVKGGKNTSRFKIIFEKIFVLVVLAVMTFILFVKSNKKTTSIVEDVEPRIEISIEKVLKDEVFGILMPQKVLDGYIMEDTPGIYGSGDSKVLIVKYYNAIQNDEMTIKISSKTWFLNHEPESIETNVVKYQYTLQGVSSYIYFEKDDVIISYSFTNRDINRIDDFYDMVNTSEYFTRK